MGIIRPELQAWLAPRRELTGAVAIIVFGLWIITLGGWFYILIGLAMSATGTGWALGSWRRLAFLRHISAPGVVEVVEGEIRYLAPDISGGSIALADLNEIRLLRLNGHDRWRLKTNRGEALLIPVEARGAEQLADAFASLPGLDMGRVSSALGQNDGPALRIVWSVNKPG